jgi:hypothetical protein
MCVCNPDRSWGRVSFSSFLLAGASPLQMPTDSAQDAPMREAIKRAYIQLTGKEPLFCFSGWNAELDEYEQAALKIEHQITP